METLVSQIGAPLIAVLVPLAVAAFKKFVWANVPGFLLPLFAALLGPLFDVAIAYLTGLQAVGGIAAVVAGLAGVGLREVKDQVTKAVTNAP